MPLKIVHREHTSIVGRGFVLLTTSHGSNPDSEFDSGRIVEEAALLSKCYAVIGRASGEFLDPDRIHAAQLGMKKSIETFLDEEGVRCVLDIRGVHGAGIDIGITRGRRGSDSMAELVERRLAIHFKVSTDLDKIRLETSQSTATSETSSGGDARTELILAIGDDEMMYRKDLLVRDIVDVVMLINQKLGSLRERRGK